jgi:putative (di)nucleoside polyphosphate hydrolase
MNDLIDSDGFRANVGIVLMHDDGHVFIGRRSGGRGWQFPQGGVRPGERAVDALYRELHEEIGLTRGDVELVAQTRGWLRYRLPERFVRHDSLPTCIGQKQRWFLLRSRRAGVQFRFDTTGEPEFDRWRWVDWWQPVREVIYFKRTVYTRALHELAALAFPAGGPAYPDWWHAPVTPGTGDTGTQAALVDTGRHAALADPGEPAAADTASVAGSS